MGFQTITRLDPKIVSAIFKYWNGDYPINILDQIKEDSPWAVMYTTSNTYKDGMKQVSFDNKEAIVYDETLNTTVKTFNWWESTGTITDGTIHCYAIHLEEGVFAYYICDSQGPPGPPQGGVAIALGPPGGLPNETLYAAKYMKREMKKMNINLDITCSINVPFTS